MRNLRNIQHIALRNDEGPRPSACCWDVASDSLICAFGPSKDDTLVRLKRWNLKRQDNGSVEHSLELIASWDAPCPLPDLECDRVLDIRYFQDISTVCLVLAGGDIVVVREHPLPGEEKIEIVGSVDVGISAASWSPDEELLAIATNGDTFLYMTREFESVADIKLVPEDLKASKHVSVGWGKSETQFKGKGARALRDPTVPEKVDQGLLSSRDDRSATISWRGDGSFVAVNSIQASDRRVIRVYSRDGSLDGVSEPVDYMESALSWRPAGNLIASVQRLQDRMDVIFFERNGLRHGQFSLRLSQEDMDSIGVNVSLKWNVDSTVLAICFLDRVQMWTMDNYHYYLKQEISLPLASSTYKSYFSWHPEEPLLFAIGSEEAVERLDYVYRVSSGSTLPPHDHGIVGVIDGVNLKVTPMQFANVPPPMSLHEISARSNILDVCFWEASASSIQIAVLDRQGISLFYWSLKRRAVECPTLSTYFEISSFEEDSPSHNTTPQYQQVVFRDAETLLVLAANGLHSTIHTLKLTSGTMKSISILKSPLVHEIIPNSPSSSSSVYAWANGGSVVESQHDEWSPGSKLVLWESKLTALPRRLDRVTICRGGHAPESNGIGMLNGIEFNDIIFGLTRNGSLYANDRCLAKDCTSFVTTTAHLIYTTSQHLVKFVHMTNVEALEIPPDTPEADERCRTIERGAKIVTVVPSSSALTLQMPRGNLETIYPRALVLAKIRQDINEKKYRDAFLNCRNHRVDMNILHDHAPEDFNRNIDLFIDQVQKVEHVDLFLSQLRNEDVSLTMYKETLPSKNSALRPQQSPVTSLDAQPMCKVNRTCDNFLRALRTRTTTNLQNLITAHVCKVPPDFEAGLLEVSKLQKSNSDDAERAVEHICFLADVNRLYDYALGLYDLDLALSVVQQSQQDPREYLPFLQRLRDQPLLRMKFDIDDHLKRYSKALVHLKDINVFDELKAYIMKHALYQDALQLCRYEEDKIQKIMELYAQHLSQRSRYKDAGTAYEYLRDYTAAAASYRLAHLWREALACANLVPMEDHELQTFADAICESLVELKDYQPAATIRLDYLQDLDGSIRLYCKGYYFADAIRLLSLHRRNDLLESAIDVGLAEGQAAMTEMLADFKSQLNAQVPRIRELRLKKAQEPLAFYDADVNGGADIPDNVSLAGTDASTAGGTLFTRYTNRTGTVGTNATRKTSKHKMKEERKRARGKKGSVYEEEYLVNSVGRLIERLNSIGDEVQRLVEGLMRRGMRERAKAVEASMVSVVELCKQCVVEVFEVPDIEGDSKRDPNEAFQRPTGGDGVLWDSMEESRTRKEAPIVKPFERLSILGS